MQMQIFKFMIIIIKMQHLYFMILAKLHPYILCNHIGVGER